VFFVKEAKVYFILMVLIGGVALVGINYAEEQAAIKIEAQRQSYNDILALNGYKTQIYASGNGGMFIGSANLIYLRTDKTNSSVCLNFLHELGHLQQKNSGDPCFQSKDLLACEDGAKKYASANAYRCDGI